MNKTLFLHNIKKQSTLWLIFLSVMIFYALIIIVMYDPSSVDDLNAMFDMMPDEMMLAFGFTEAFYDLVSFLASWLYGFIMTTFPMVYSILLGHRLVGKMVDNGSMVCLVCSPVSRRRIAITQGIYGIFSLLLMMAITFFVIWGGCALWFPDELLDLQLLFSLHLTVTMVNLTVFAITFCCSCIFSSAKWSTGLGAGIPIGFMVLEMLSNVSEKGEWIRALTIYGWYDASGIVGGDSILINWVYLAVIVVLFIVGVRVFERKQLHI